MFEAARAATVHPLAVSANRNAFVQLIRSNFLGLNAPAIMAAEAQYEEMWAADVAAMVGYHGGASAVAAQLSSWQQTLKGLPGIGQLFGSPAAGAAAAGDPNLGIGNKGTGGLNVGNGNTATTTGQRKHRQPKHRRRKQRQLQRWRRQQRHRKLWQRKHRHRKLRPWETAAAALPRPGNMGWVTLATATSAWVTRQRERGRRKHR